MEDLMKKVCINLLTIIAISCLTSSQALARVYLQNNYGAPIRYSNESDASVRPYKYETLGNGAKVEIKAVQNVRDIFQPKPLLLFISSVGGSYTDISYLFRDIQIQQTNHRGEDAVIVVYPRQGLSGIYNWNVQIEWENPASAKVTPMQE